MADAKKTVVFKMRLTEKEYDKLKAQSERTGRTMSDIMRAAWKRLKVVELPPADLSETVVLLRRIGGELSRLAFAANEGEIRVPEINSALGEIAALDRGLTALMAGGGA